MSSNFKDFYCSYCKTTQFLRKKRNRKTCGSKECIKANNNNRLKKQRAKNKKASPVKKKAVTRHAKKALVKRESKANKKNKNIFTLDVTGLKDVGDKVAYKHSNDISALTVGSYVVLFGLRHEIDRVKDDILVANSTAKTSVNGERQTILISEFEVEKRILMSNGTRKKRGSNVE